MKVSLKKAAALSSALLAVKVEVPTTVSVSMYDIPTPEGLKEAVVAAIADRDASVVSKLNCIATAYTIRKLIGVANHNSDINALMNEKVAIEKAMAVFASIPERTQDVNVTAVIEQLNDLREKSKTSTYGTTSNISINLPFVNDMKMPQKRMREINDALTHLNFTTEIELPDDVVAVLKDNDLI